MAVYRSAKAIRHVAWRKLEGNWGAAALSTFLVALMNSFFSSLVGEILYLFVLLLFVEWASVGWGIIGALVFPILFISSFLLSYFPSGPLNLGMTGAPINVCKGYHWRVSTVFSGFYDVGRAFWLDFTISLFSALWALLLIFPGIIYYYSTSIARFLIWDRFEITVCGARRLSKQIMRGNKTRMFCLELSFIGWFALCVLTCGILSFWVIPYVQTARAELYRDLIGANDELYASTDEVEQTQNEENEGLQSVVVEVV